MVGSTIIANYQLTRSVQDERAERASPPEFWGSPRREVQGFLKRSPLGFSRNAFRIQKASGARYRGIAFVTDQPSVLSGAMRQLRLGSREEAFMRPRFLRNGLKDPFDRVTRVSR